MTNTKEWEKAVYDWCGEFIDGGEDMDAYWQNSLKELIQSILSRRDAEVVEIVEREVEKLKVNVAVETPSGDIHDSLVRVACAMASQLERNILAALKSPEKEKCCAECITPASGAPDETVMECLDPKCRYCHALKSEGGEEKAMKTCWLAEGKEKTESSEMVPVYLGEWGFTLSPYKAKQFSTKGLCLKEIHERDKKDFFGNAFLPIQHSFEVALKDQTKEQ